MLLNISIPTLNLRFGIWSFPTTIYIISTTVNLKERWSKEVESGGWAAVGEIMPGDIIQSIGGQKITSADDAKNALKEIAGKKPKEVVFFVWRYNKTSFVNVKTDW